MNTIESVPVAPARVFKALCEPARPEGTRSVSPKPEVRAASPSSATPSSRFRALSSDDLRRCAPSIFAEHARPGVSSRYTFVSTQQVVALLGAEGWEPVKASEQRVRLEDRIGFQMHEIRFARRVDIDAGALQVGSTRAEMILQNAHDGSRAYRIDAGLYRLVCRNGLTVADADFAHVSIRHMDVSSTNLSTSWLRTVVAPAVWPELKSLADDLALKADAIALEQTWSTQGNEKLKKAIKALPR